jgi:hypothetical protein
MFWLMKETLKNKTSTSYNKSNEVVERQAFYSSKLITSTVLE